MTIRHLAYRIAHSYPGSVNRLAAEMGKGVQVLTNKLNPNSETHHLTVDELQMIADFTGRNLEVADFFAQKADAVVVPIPEIEQGDMGLLDAYLAADVERGMISQRFMRAYADGRIDPQEFEEIKIQTFSAIAKQLAWLAEIERVVK